MKKVPEPDTKTIKDVSEVVRKTMTESSKENNKALAKINDNFLQIKNDRCVLATFLLSPLSKCSSFKLTTSGGKQSDDISHARIVSLLYKLITSSGGSDDLSIGFDCNCGRRRQDLTNNKNMNGNHLVRIRLKGVFGFADQQENLLMV